MTKINFQQYKAKQDFLKAFSIQNGSLDLCDKGITDADLTHILQLLGDEPNLKYLYLEYNQLSTLHADTFKGLTNLKWLSLNYNQLSTLHADTFKGLTNLESLRLNYNQLSTLHADAFKGLTNLEWLYLNNNQLSTLPTAIKNALPNCDIYIDDNVIYVDENTTEEIEKCGNLTNELNCGNLTNQLNAKILKIDLEISKLQKDKEVLQGAVEMLKIITVI